MSSYLPFARKYRPSEFADLVGQDVLTQTLSQAIKNGKCPQGIILSGIRGVGKTTSARIIAKIINCQNLQISDAGVKSCGSCVSCTSIQNNNHPDVIEMDAASATGVDDVRQIIDSAEYKPLIGKFKVYIIDEVHMFSKSAFNALLKILEEPPAHAIFILATTELNKIPPTIISRCHRFSLRRLSASDIVALLTTICEKEEVSFEDSALELIAIKSEGSARDAVSMLDQAATLASQDADGIVTVSLVSTMVGSGDLDVAVNFFIAVANSETEVALDILKTVYQYSNNLTEFIENVIDIIGYVNKLKAIGQYQSSVYHLHHAKLCDVAKTLDLRYLIVVWQIFAKGLSELKVVHNQLLLAEVITINAIYASSLPSPQEVVESAIRALPRRR